MMGKFEVIAIVAGVFILFFYSQLEMAPSTATTGRSSGLSVSQQPGPREASRRPGRVGQTIPSQGSTSSDSSFHGKKIQRVMRAAGLRAIDGDSIAAELTDGTNLEIRLASIDAPEHNQTSGRSAQRHLANLIQGRSADIFQTDTDRYDRTVAFVVTDEGINLNAQMVGDGWAWHATRYSDDQGLGRLQQSAQAARIGLWSSASPVAPWDFRK